MAARNYDNWSNEALRLRIDDLERRDKELRRALAFALLGLKTTAELADERIEKALGMAPKGTPKP